ncbi:MAG: ComEC/Rec2 family competence protein, partial [Spirochaetales bacterium]|nr:ComEC/Rec2 family competence protein [Spirochaetales bacterium]
MKYLMICLLLSVLSICLLTCAAGCIIIASHLVFVLLSYLSACGALFPSAKIRQAAMVTFMCLAATILALVTCRSLDLEICFPEQYITRIEGNVVYDSSFTRSGNHMMKVRLRECITNTGDRGTASGVVTVVGDESQIISAGVRVRLDGAFSDGIFIYDDIRVLERNSLNDIRENLISRLQRRVLGDDDDEASLLSSLLLLGRADGAVTGLQEKARQCGCAHVLALSGMHLGLLAGLCMSLFGKGRLARIMAFAAVSAFVFTAGPRASLIRAALSFFLFFIPIKERTVAVFCLHMALFPMTTGELGCCYGYLAIFAIVSLSPYIRAVLFQYCGRLSSLISASLAVLVFSAPVYILQNGFWCPAVILASPLAGLLAGLSMSMGLLLLAFGRAAWILKANNLIFTGMERLFDMLLDFPKAGWLGYGILTLLLLSLFVLNRLQHQW